MDDALVSRVEADDYGQSDLHHSFEQRLARTIVTLYDLLVEANDAFDEVTGDYCKELVAGESWRRMTAAGQASTATGTGERCPTCRCVSAQGSSTRPTVCSDDWHAGPATEETT